MEVWRLLAIFFNGSRSWRDMLIVVSATIVSPLSTGTARLRSTSANAWQRHLRQIAAITNQGPQGLVYTFARRIASFTVSCSCAGADGA